MSKAIKRLQQRELPFDLRWIPRTGKWRAVVSIGDGVWKHGEDADTITQAAKNAAKMLWGK